MPKIVTANRPILEAVGHKWESWYMINPLHAKGPETTKIWLNFISFVDIRMAKVVKMCHQMMQEYTLFIVISETIASKYIAALMQERRNSIANALELRLSCTYPAIHWPSFLRKFLTLHHTYIDICALWIKILIIRSECAHYIHSRTQSACIHLYICL